MKLDKKKIKKLVIILIIISILLVPVILFDRVFPFLFVTRVKNTIEIRSDEDFAKYDFPGNGSKENPIIISNMKIGTSNKRIHRAYRLIIISNTSYHIVIENCLFLGGLISLNIWGLRGGSIMIRDNSFIGFDHYIGLDGRFTTIFLEISGAHDVCIENNTFEGRSWGYLFLHEVYNSVISNNSMTSEEDHSGLEIDDCQNLVIENNLIEGSIWIFDSDNLNITNNEIFNYDYGLLIQNGNNSSVIRNTFMNCSNYAIRLDSETMFIDIYHNSFLENNVEGVSQAQDLGSNNTWFSMLLLEGNFWSNLGLNSTYEIDGSAGSVDLYPLSSPLI